MDQNQKRYAMARVESVLKDKLEALREKFTKKGVKPSDKVKMKAIRDQSVGLHYGSRINLNTTLGDAFDFRHLDVDDVFDHDGYRKAEIIARREADKVRDEIMLGSDAEAKKLIQSYCGKH